MNEQALQDAYTLFQGAGYGKSFDEFVNLINTNDQALGDAYQLFQDSGYGKSLDEFSTLMGVKKKDDTSVSVAQPEEVSTESTSATAPPPEQESGDSDSVLAQPELTQPELTEQQLADLQRAAQAIDPNVETQTPYMQVNDFNASLPRFGTTVEDAIAAVADAPNEARRLGFETPEQQNTFFEGELADVLLDMDGIEKEKLSRVAGGESFFMQEEKANAALAVDEEFQRLAEESAKGLMLIEDDMTKILTGQVVMAGDLTVEDRVKDLKEQYTQELPPEFRERVERMDLSEFADYTVKNAMDRDFAAALVGMSSLETYDLEAKVGRMSGAYMALGNAEELEEGSYYGKRLGISWKDFGIADYKGLMFGLGKARVEQDDLAIAKIDSVIDNYGAAGMTEEQYEEFGSLVYDPIVSKKITEMSDEPLRDLTFFNPEQARNHRIELGKTMFQSIAPDNLRELRKSLARRKEDNIDFAELYARDYNYNGGLKDTMSQLLDARVLTEEQAKKSAWGNFLDGDYEAWAVQSFGFTADLLPDMTKAVALNYIGGPNLMAAAFGLDAGSSTIGEYASRPEVSGVEAIEIGFRAGMIEGGVTRMFPGLQNLQAGAVKKGIDLTKDIVSASSRKAQREAIRKGVKKIFASEPGRAIKDWGKEGLEEGTIAFLDQWNRVTSEVASGRMNPQEAFDEYWNMGAIGDAFWAGFLGGGVGASPFVAARGMSSVGSKFTLFDRLELKDRKTYLLEQLERGDLTDDQKKDFRAQLTKVHEDANRLARKDVEFYSQMENEDMTEIIRLNQEISKKRQRARNLARAEGRTNQTQLDALANDVRSLMTQKLEIENKYEAANAGFDMDVEAQTRNNKEVERLVDDIMNVDRKWDDVTEGQGNTGAGKIVLTDNNSDTILSRLLAQGIKGTRFATAEQIRDGIVGAFNMAKAIKADNPDAEVILVNSKEAFRREVAKAGKVSPSKVKLSRGMHISRDGGTVVLYAPALKSNTGYHEGFHQSVYRQMLKDGVNRGEAMIRLASALRRGMTKAQLAKYGNFVNQYGNVSEALKAEEFLAEVFSDMADGEIDIQFHKGIVSGFASFVKQALSAKGVKMTNTPVLQDVANGLRDAAEYFSEGEGGAQGALGAVLEASGRLRPGLGIEGVLNRRELRRHRNAQTRAQAHQQSDDLDSTVKAQDRLNEPSVLGDWTKDALTFDANGNVKLLHVGPQNLEGGFIDPRRFGQQPYTTDQRGDKVAMFYAKPEDQESMVRGRAYEATVPPQMLYDLFKDPLNFYDTALKAFRDAGNVVAFDGNRQAEWIGYEARKQGFDGMVTKWRNTARVDMWVPVRPDENGGYSPAGTKMTEADISPAKNNEYAVAAIAKNMREAIAAHKEKGTGVDGQTTPLKEETIQRMMDEGTTFYVGNNRLSSGVVSYVDKDGYMGGLTKHPDVPLRGVQAEMLRKRIEDGGNHLECFDTYLVKNNIAAGFVPVARIPFDVDRAPEGWDAPNSTLRDKPDLVFMAYDPAAAADAKPGDGVRAKSYDEGLAMARSRGEGNQSTGDLLKSQLTSFDEGDAAAIKDNDGEAIGTFYELLNSKARKLGGVSSIYRYRGLMAGFSQGRMVYVDEQVTKRPNGEPDRHIEFVFRPLDTGRILDEQLAGRQPGEDARPIPQKMREGRVIKLDEWFVTKALNEDFKPIKGADNRGSGLGTRFMNLVMETADELDIDIELMAYPTKNYQGTEQQNRKASDRLKAYYQKFGFVSSSKYSDTMVRVARTNLDQLSPAEDQATQELALGKDGVPDIELFTFFSSAVERLQDFREEQSMTREEIEQARAEDREFNAQFQFKPEPDEKYLQTRDKEMKADDLAELDVLFPGMTPEQIREEYIAAFGPTTKAQAIEATIQFDTDTGRKWTVRRKFTDEKHVKNFINYIEKKKGYTFDERWNHDTPPDVDPPEVTGVTKAQQLAVDAINSETPGELTQSIQVARALNKFAGEPVKSEGEMMTRFLNNVYEEAGFYLNQKDARTGGITWYTEDIQEAKKKMGIMFPALQGEAMGSIGTALLAVLSPGNSPIGNMTTLAAVLRNTPVDQMRSGNFSRNWGGDKMSFVDKKGKSVASGRVVKEIKTHFIVQGVDALGRDSKYRNGQNFRVKIAKKDMKAGYPKPTGYTTRGRIVAKQLDKIQSLFERFKTPEAVVKFLTTDQPIGVLREFSKSVPDSKGKVNKNPAPGRRKGAYIFGEKVGSFFLNMEGLGESLTSDLWFNRTWNRYAGTMIDTVNGKETIVEVPRSESERRLQAEAVTQAANELGLTTAELQATMWYFEQELWRSMGANTRSENYAMAIDNVASRMDLDNDTRQRLAAAGVNLDAAEAKRETAVSRADSKGIEKYRAPQEPGTEIKAQPITSVTDPDGPRFTDFKGVWGAIANAGILMHGTPANFAKFDNDLAFGPTIPGLYGNGTYLTRNVDKAAMYGKNVIFIDGQGLNLANMYSFRQGARVTTALNRLNQLGPQSYEIHKKIAMDARRGMAQRPNSPLGFRSEVGKNPEILVERIIAETVKQMQDTNNQLGSGRTTIETLRNVMYGDNGKPGVAVKAMIDFQREVNRLRYEGMDPVEAQMKALGDGLGNKDAIDDAMAIARYTFAEIVRQAGFDGYYFSAEMDRGYQGIERRAKEGKLETREQQEMKLEALEIAGTDGGFAQEAIIVNTDRLNDLIIPAENVIAAAVSRITAEESTIDQGGQMGNNGVINDGMRDSQNLLKAQPLQGFLDDYDADMDTLRGEKPPARIDREAEMGKVQRAMLGIMEFVYDKFYRAIRYQRDIEKAIGGSVMQEQDYAMALSLLDGKASRRLQSVDMFMEDLAAVMNKFGISHKELSDFLYAMHAENRNAVLRERFGNKKKSITDSIAQQAALINDENSSDAVKRKASKKLADLQEELADVEARLENDNFSGKTDEQARREIEELDGEGMRQAYDMVMEFQAETRKLIVEYGMETQATVDKLEALYPSYVPLSGFAIDEDGGSEAREAGYLHMHQARVFRGIRRAEGRTSLADSPLDYIFERRYQTVMAGEKNLANSRLLNLLADNPDKDLYKVYGPKDATPVLRGKRRGMTRDEMRNNDRFVEVVVNGESFFMEFANSAVARAVNKHNILKSPEGVPGMIFNAIRGLGRFLSSTFTSYSPDFIVANFTRDLQFGLGSLLAEQEIEGGQAFGQDLVKSTLKKHLPSLAFLYKNLQGVEDTSHPMYKAWQEFQDSGAITDWPYAKNRDKLRSDLETLTRMQEGGAGVTAVKGLKAVADYVNNTNMAVENAIRFAVFQSAREAGMNAEKAAYLAKELTINFNRSGSGGSVINALYLFFNAGVQGTAKFARTMLQLKKVPNGRGGYYRTLNSSQKIAMGMTLFAAAQAALNQAISDEDEDGRTFYEKIPDYVKERNMIVMIGGKDYIKIPLPYGYNIFHNMGTMSYEAATGIRTAGDAGAFMVGGMVNSFIPISFGESSTALRKLGKAGTPTFLRPFLEIYMNESYFGTQVYKDNAPGQNMPMSSLGSRSPEWLRDVTMFLNEVTGGNEYEAGYLDMSPDKIWHAFEYYGGGGYRFLKNTYKAVETPVQHLQGYSDDKEEVAGKVLSTMPIVRVGYGTYNSRVDMADYYKFRTTVKQAVEARENLNLDEPRTRAAAALEAEGRKIDKALQAMRKDIRAIKDRDIDPALKAREVDKLEQEMLRLVLSFNKQYLEQYEGRKKKD